MQAVKIKQADNADTVEFVAKESHAFLGAGTTGRTGVPLASIGGPAPVPGEATVVFDKPVTPGSTVTIALQANRNPRYSGIYLFGVTAFPKGENGRGQFLGFGRVQIHSR